MRSILAGLLLAVPCLVAGQAEPGWPADIESLLVRYVAELPNGNFSEITAHCESRECEVTFFGAGAGAHVSAQMHTAVVSGLYRQGLGVMTSSFGTREIRPGAYQFVLTVSNVPHVE